MKKLRFISILTLFLSLSFSFTLVQAASPTPETEVTENLKERLKNTVSGITVNEVSEPASTRGYVGKVTDIIQNTIILEDKSGKKSIKVTDDSVIIRSPGSTEIELSSVRIDDSIIAIGSLVNEEEVAGKRLIVSSSELDSIEKISGLSTIKEIGRYSLILTNTQEEGEFELFFTKNTVYKNKEGILEFNDLSVGDQILYAAKKDSDDDWSATVIMQTKKSPDLTSQEESVE